MKASSASTCLVRSGLRAVGSSAPGTDILPAENWCIPSEPSVRAFGTTVGYPLGETLPCSACGKSHWWQTGQWRLEGYSFSGKLGILTAVFCPGTDWHSLEIPSCSTPCMLGLEFVWRVLIGSPCRQLSWSSAPGLMQHNWSWNFITESRQNYM